MKTIRVVGIVLLCLALLLASTSCSTADKSPPISPTNLAQTTGNSDNTPTFTWDVDTEDKGIAGYLVRIDGGEWTDIGDISTYTWENTIPDGSHTFEVKAVDKVGNESVAASLTFTIDTTPPVISAVSAAAADTSATITWSTDEPATSQVEYGLSASYGTSTTLDSSLVTSHSVSLSGLDPEITYHYQVIAKDVSGNTARSVDYFFPTLPDTTAPNAPVGLTLTSGYKEVKLDWAAGTEADLAGYNVYRSDSADSGFILVNGTLPTATSYLDTGLTPDTDYYYRLTAIDLYENESAKSEYATAKTLAATAAFPAYLDYGGILITGSGSYEYLLCHIANSSLRSVTIDAVEVYDQIGGLVDSDSALQVVLGPGEGHSYNVYYNLGWMPDLGGWWVKWHGMDAEGAQFTAIGLSTVPDNIAPVISDVTSSGTTATSVTITWSTNEPASGQVEYGTTTSYGSASSLNTTLVQSHSVSLSGLSIAATYHFRVKSKDAVGNEAVSEDFSFTTPGTVVGGMISDNTTWSKAASPYLITSTIQVPPGITLTVEPGIVMEFRPSCKLQVAGALVAVGTSQEGITFTSSDDFWSGIEFTNYGQIPSSIEYATIEHVLNASGSPAYAAVNGGQLSSFSHNTIRDCQSAGIDVGSVGEVSYNVIENCTGYGIYAWYAPSLIAHNKITNCGVAMRLTLGDNQEAYVQYNTITNNGGGIQVGGGRSGPFDRVLHVNYNNIYSNGQYNIDCVSYNFPYPDMVDASNNWWGTIDAAAIDQSIYDFHDDMNYAEVTYEPIATAPIPDAP